MKSQTNSPENQSSVYSPPAQPPQSLPEALARIHEAHELYESIVPPDTSYLPDTPPATFKEAVDGRVEQYWLDRNDLAYDSSEAGLRAKIDAPSEELREWALAKCKLASRVWGEHVAAGIFVERHKDKLPPEVSAEEAANMVTADPKQWEELVDLMTGRVRVTIKDGRPSIESNDFGAQFNDALEAISDHKEAWDQRHERLVKAAPRLAKVLRTASILRPFATRLNPNEPGSVLDAANYIYFASLRDGAHDKSAKPLNTPGAH